MAKPLTTLDNCGMLFWPFGHGSFVADIFPTILAV